MWFFVFFFLSFFIPKTIFADGVCNLNPLSWCREKADIRNFQTHLPVFNIDTKKDGEPQAIVKDHKIWAKLNWMEPSSNSEWNIRRLDQSQEGSQSSLIQVRVRGQSSSKFKQKSYAISFFEDKKEKGEYQEKKLGFLGMSESDDWVAHGPFVDKTLMRNSLTFGIARRLKGSDGSRWYAPRTRFAEVLVDHEYRGVYTMIEKISPSSDRIDIKTFKMKAALENLDRVEFILKVDPVGPDDSHYFTTRRHQITISVDYPGKGKMDTFLHDSPGMYGMFMEKIRAFMNHFEDVLEDPSSGHLEEFVDLRSFANYIWIQNVTKNIDGFRRSVYFYVKFDKETRKWRIFAGPIWDFNLAYGNLWFYHQENVENWQHGHGFYIDGNQEIPWFNKMLQYKKFRNLAVRIFEDERQPGGAFHYDTFVNEIDSRVAAIGEEAILRNFTKWNVLGAPILRFFYFNPPSFPLHYSGEIQKLKTWIHGRLRWLGENYTEIRRPDPARHTGLLEEARALAHKRKNEAEEVIRRKMRKHAF